MRLQFRLANILLILVFVAYSGAEWFLLTYQSGIAAAREAHNYHRALFISAARLQQSSSIRSEGASTPAGNRAGLKNTDLLSPETFAWLNSRSYVESIHHMSVQAWSAITHGPTLDALFIYGIDERSVSEFNLGDPQALSGGDLVLTNQTKAKLDPGDKDNFVVLTLPSEVAQQISTQIPPELSQQLVAQQHRIGVSSTTLYGPPGLRADRHVAYIHRDADQLGGPIQPGSLMVLLLKEEVDPLDAQAEIQSLLRQQIASEPDLLRLSVRTIDQFHPPLIPTSVIDFWIGALRGSLLAFVFLIGIGFAWMRSRQHFFEISIRRAIGDRRLRALTQVYGPWLLSLTVSMFVGASVVWLLRIANDSTQGLVESILMVAAASGLIAAGCLMIALGSLNRSPLHDLSKSA